MGLAESCAHELKMGPVDMIVCSLPTTSFQRHGGGKEWS